MTYVTPFYASIMILMFIVLSVRTLRLRRKLGIPVGDSGDERMLRAMRVHANFAEYVPLALLGIFLYEMQGGHRALAHVLCLCLLAGRLSHAWGVWDMHENYRFRVFGMAMTFTALVGAAAAILISYLPVVTG